MLTCTNTLRNILEYTMSSPFLGYVKTEAELINAAEFV